MSDFRIELAPGARVHHHGERFPRAYCEGTATILECTKHHGDGTHEYLARKDDGTVVSWNDVHPVSPGGFSND